MKQEIERKFLLSNTSWKGLADDGSKITQGFLSSNPERVIRIRIINNAGILTVKGKLKGITRKEFEYDIPLDEAKQLLELCEKPIIQKTRFKIYLDDLLWEIDVFEGVNAGLVIAEVELKSETVNFEIPDWIGKEVSDDMRYYNVNLMMNPFSEWNK
jgi:adenylate cyclase